MKAIQEWLGHSTFHVTADFYSHLDFNSKIDSANTIANILGGRAVERPPAAESKRVESQNTTDDTKK
jgi:hypothetical protein